jgi:hypothetical protein
MLASWHEEKIGGTLYPDEGQGAEEDDSHLRSRVIEWV